MSIVQDQLSNAAMEDMRTLSQQMRQEYDGTGEDSVNSATQLLDSVQSDMTALFSMVKIRIHKMSGQHQATNAKEAKQLVNAVNASNAMLRKRLELVKLESRSVPALDEKVTQKPDFEQQLSTFRKQLNGISIELEKLKTISESIMTVYSNYHLDGECNSSDAADEDSEGTSEGH